MEIRVDPARGHISLIAGSETAVTLTDVGPVLHVWQHGDGVELDHVAARRLGAALIEWANRKVLTTRKRGA